MQQIVSGEKFLSICNKNEKQVERGDRCSLFDLLQKATILDGLAMTAGG
jgi:hypothetical protein